MKTNITIGQYYPTDSIIHSLDARIKLLATVVFIVLMLMIKNAYGYIFAMICIIVIIKMSKVPFKLVLRSLKGIFAIVLFTFLINILITQGDIILFKFGFLQITKEGLFLAIKMLVRLILMVVGSTVVTLSTSPLELTNAIESILKPFKVFKVPAHDIAMVMSMTLRFIPLLMEEMDKIIKAQKARGADFESGGIIKKAKNMVPILVPLFLSSFRRAEELSIAMEARCYRGDVNRTRLREMQFKKRDYFTILVLILYTIAIMIINRF